jgi:hypothetical protein
MKADYMILRGEITRLGCGFNSMFHTSKTWRTSFKGSCVVLTNKNILSISILVLGDKDMSFMLSILF